MTRVVVGIEGRRTDVIHDTSRLGYDFRDQAVTVLASGFSPDQPHRQCHKNNGHNPQDVNSQPDQSESQCRNQNDELF